MEPRNDGDRRPLTPEPPEVEAVAAVPAPTAAVTQHERKTISWGACATVVFVLASAMWFLATPSNFAPRSLEAVVALMREIAALVVVFPNLERALAGEPRREREGAVAGMIKGLAMALILLTISSLMETHFASTATPSHGPPNHAADAGTTPEAAQ
jgi:hypothetical protein